MIGDICYYEKVDHWFSSFGLWLCVE